MSVVRESPTPAERTLLNLDERIDRLGDVTNHDAVPTAQQNHDVRRGLDRLEKQLPQQVDMATGSRAEVLMTTAGEQWNEAETASHHSQWNRAADAIVETLRALSVVIGEASGRPSVLSATPEDAEAILARAIRREETKPGKHEFHDLTRLNAPGFPSEAFGLVIEAVAGALVEGGFDEEGEPPPEHRRPLLKSAINRVRLGALGSRNG